MTSNACMSAKGPLALNKSGGLKLCILLTIQTAFHPIPNTSIAIYSTLDHFVKKTKVCCHTVNYYKQKRAKKIGCIIHKYQICDNLINDNNRAKNN